jgi:hypothetical protein
LALGVAALATGAWTGWKWLDVAELGCGAR